MAEVSVTQLATDIDTSVERLLQQFTAAGLSKSVDDMVSEDEKQTLLNHLKKQHGGGDAAGAPRRRGEGVEQLAHGLQASLDHGRQGGLAQGLGVAQPLGRAAAVAQVGGQVQSFHGVRTVVHGCAGGMRASCRTSARQGRMGASVKCAIF